MAGPGWGRRAPGGIQGGLVKSPRGHVSPNPGRQDQRAVRRPTGGRTIWAEALTGPDRPIYAREKREIAKERNTGKTGSYTQRWGRGVLA